MNLNLKHFFIVVSVLGVIGRVYFDGALQETADHCAGIGFIGLYQVLKGNW